MVGGYIFGISGFWCARYNILGFFSGPPLSLFLKLSFHESFYVDLGYKVNTEGLLKLRSFTRNYQMLQKKGGLRTEFTGDSLKYYLK